MLGGAGGLLPSMDNTSLRFFADYTLLRLNAVGNDEAAKESSDKLFAQGGLSVKRMFGVDG